MMKACLLEQVRAAHDESLFAIKQVRAGHIESLLARTSRTSTY